MFWRENWWDSYRKEPDVQGDVHSIDNPEVYNLDGKYVGHWKDFTNEPYTSQRYYELLQQLKVGNLQKMDAITDVADDTSWFYNDVLNEEEQQRMDDVVKFGSSALFNLLNPSEWDDFLGWLKGSDVYHRRQIMATLQDKNIPDSEKYDRLAKTDDYLQSFLLSIGSALTASAFAAELKALDEKLNLKSDYDLYAAGQYSQLPGDYYKNAYDPSRYDLEPVYDENGKLVQGVYRKAFDDYQGMPVEQIPGGLGGLGGGVYRSSVGDSFSNAVFYAAMYGMKQFIYDGLVYTTARYKGATGYSGVGNPPIGGQSSDFTDDWYYSKDMRKMGVGGWMKSKHGDYLIKKRVFYQQN